MQTCMGAAWMCLVMVFLQYAYGNKLHFPNTEMATHVCEEPLSLPLSIDSVPAIGGTLPITYSLSVSGYTDYFTIKSGTGNIFLVKSLANTSNPNIALHKRAEDIVGNKVEMKINLIVTPVHSATLVCPTTIQLVVRETAPVGEEVGAVRCTALAMENASQIKSTVVTPISKGNYLPFKVNSHGIIVVSAPLAFMNSISDIFIVNVVVNNRQHEYEARHCNRTETQVSVRITLVKSGCPSNWTYTLDKNTYLDLQPSYSMSVISISQCMSSCSSCTPTPCNSFVYNPVKKECQLFNSTVFTEPNFVRNRIGLFMYRKYCEIDPLPAFILRNLSHKIQLQSNPIFSPNRSILYLEDLLADMGDVANMTLRNVLLSANILYGIAGNTSVTNASLGEVETYIYVTGQVIDRLQTYLVSLPEAHGSTFNVVIRTFDSLMESLRDILRYDGTDLEASSNTSSVRLTTISSVTNQVSISVSAGTSSVSLLRHCDTHQDCPNVNVLIGVMNGVDRLTNQILAEEISSSAFSRGYTVVGHLLSVIMNPPLDSSSAVQLDIHTSHIAEDIADSVCAFLKKYDASLALYGYGSIFWAAINHKWAALNKNNPLHGLSSGHKVSLDVISVIGCCVSTAALSTTVAILLWLRLRSERYILLLHLSVAIILAQVVYLAGVDAVEVKVVCRLVAILLHYLYLAVFSLMLAEGIHLYHKLHRAFCMDDNFTMFLILGWGSPLAIVSLSLLTDPDGYGTNQHCWLSTSGAIWAFVAPALTIISINMAILAMIIHTFLGVTINAKKADSEKFKRSVKATVVLLPLLGVTWLFGVIAVNKSTVVFQYIFAILNSLQGLFIFLFHIVLNDEVRRCCNKYRKRVATQSFSDAQYHLDRKNITLSTKPEPLTT